MAADVELTDREAPSPDREQAAPQGAAQAAPTAIDPGLGAMLRSTNGDPEQIAAQLIATGRTQDSRLWNQLQHTMGNAYAVRIQQAVQRQRRPGQETANETKLPDVATPDVAPPAQEAPPQAPSLMQSPDATVAPAAPQEAAARTGDDGTLTEQVERMVLGVTITAPAGVRPSAIDECARVVEAQVGDNEHAQRAFQRSRVSIVIIPARTAMTDVPELAHLRGKKTFDGRDWSTVRGMGGVRTPNRRFSIAVAEESVAQVEGVKSAYPATYSVAMHELAHVLESRGMTRQQRNRVKNLYRAAQRRDPDNGDGTFTDQYASENEHEYFAQATNTFFGRNGMADNKNGREYLRQTDPLMYELLVEMYERPQDEHGQVA